MHQQEQTQDYFGSHAEEWNNKAAYKGYSVIENRHNAVLEIMRAFPGGASLLDVGCGTGQLVIEASKLGWNAHGIDFAEEMIEICLKNRQIASTNARFTCSSIFETNLEQDFYDVISAQGFIEYISLEQLTKFLSIAHSSLKINGAIALGSRNRLFNLHSLNSFTNLELSLGTLEKLIKEAIVLQDSQEQDEAIGNLKTLAYEYEQPESHPSTGIKVKTRYQFSPSDLVSKLTKNGYDVKKIFPVHFHPLPIGMLDDALGNVVHNQLAKLASSSWIGNHKLIPYSSSFVIEARKK
jgi:2-polyprenyl-3-methyl-5-hydroxy-6-metoxy-1,4-benzoquinol methylase